MASSSSSFSKEAEVSVAPLTYKKYTLDEYVDMVSPPHNSKFKPTLRRLLQQVPNVLEQALPTTSNAYVALVNACRSSVGQTTTPLMCNYILYMLGVMQPAHVDGMAASVSVLPNGVRHSNVKPSSTFVLLTTSIDDQRYLTDTFDAQIMLRNVQPGARIAAASSTPPDAGQIDAVVEIALRRALKENRPLDAAITLYWLMYWMSVVQQERRCATAPSKRMLQDATEQLGRVLRPFSVSNLKQAFDDMQRASEGNNKLNKFVRNLRLWAEAQEAPSPRIMSAGVAVPEEDESDVEVVETKTTSTVQMPMTYAVSTFSTCMLVEPPNTECGCRVVTVPLTSQMHSLLARDDEQTVVLEKTLAGDPVTIKDVRRMRVGQCVGDVMINAYLQLVQQKGPRAEWRRQHAVTTLDTNLYQDMTIRGTNDYRSAFRAGSYLKSELFLFDNQHKMFLMPINIREVHWVLVSIDVDQRRLMYYDSLESGDGWQCDSDSQRVLQNVTQFLFERYQAEKQVNAQQAMQYITSWQTPAVVRVPQQRDGYNCGVFVCAFGAALLMGAPPTFVTADNVDEFRLHVLHDVMTSNVTLNVVFNQHRQQQEPNVVDLTAESEEDEEEEDIFAPKTIRREREIIIAPSAKQRREREEDEDKVNKQSPEIKRRRT